METIETTKVEVAPLSEMSKADIAKHIREIHNYNSIYSPRNGGYHTVNSKMKMTKDELIEWHANQHRILDKPSEELWKEGHQTRCRSEAGHVYETRTPAIDHIHTEITVTDELKADVETIKSGERISDRILSAGERKVLTDLVNNDFNNTEQKIREMAADALAQALRGVKDQHQQNVEAEQRFLKIRREAIEDARADINDAIKELTLAGVTVSRGELQLSGYEPTFSYETYDKEVKRIKDENQQMLQRALVTLERQRLTAQRRILLNGVTEQAAALLDTVPTAQELMVEAAAQQSRVAIEA